MGLKRHLAHALCRDFPDEAASVLEGLAVEEAASVLELAPPEVGARVLGRSTPAFAALVVGAMPRESAVVLLSLLAPDAGAAVLRQVEPGPRADLLGPLAAAQRDPIERLLAFAPQTAGALMDPLVFSVPADVSAAEATRRIRDAAQHARYNVYVTDRSHKLVGVMNLRELLLAAPGELVGSQMHPAIHRLSPGADRYAIVSHPGWRFVHSLPVVDSEGRYLGAVRYRTLRRIEDEIRDAPTAPGDATTRALAYPSWPRRWVGSSRP